MTIFLLLVGASLRFARFGEVPPGLYHDEAQNGLDALTVLEGELPIYFEMNNGREPFFIYLTAVSVGILGRSPFAVRLPSFYVGFLSLAATYSMGRVLFNRKIARYTLAVLAVTFWHIHLSRVGYRAGLLPLFTALYISFVAKAIRYKKTHYVILGGVLYGFSWYTYMAARFTPVAIAVLIVYSIATQRQWILKNQMWRNILYFVCSALLVLLPLGIYTITHPDVVLSRTGQVSIFNDDINSGNLGGTFLSHTLRSLGMFTIRGDRIWRHNLSYRPVWTAGLNVVFLIGLGVALAGFRKSAATATVLLWTSVMLLPTLLAEDAPHFLRAVGVLPTTALLPALGLHWLQHRLYQWMNVQNTFNVKPFRRRCLSVSIPWLLVISGGILSTYDYFLTYAQSPLVYHWFESGPVTMAQTINSLSGHGWDGQTIRKESTGDRTVCIDPVLWDSWTAVAFLTPSSSICFLPIQNPPADLGTVFVVWPYDDWRQKFGSSLPRPSYLYINLGPTAQGDLDPYPFISSLFLYADPLPPLPPTIAQYENGMELHAALVEPQYDQAMVKLWWTISQTQTSPSTVFIHYIRDGMRIAQSDGQPGNDELPTTFWVLGDVILDKHLMADIAPDVVADKLRIGVYYSDTGENIPLVNENLAAELWYETNIILTP